MEEHCFEKGGDLCTIFEIAGVSVKVINPVLPRYQSHQLASTTNEEI